MNQIGTQIWWFKRMVAVVTIQNYLHILADILYAGKITPVDAMQQISVNKMFYSICRIANYSVDNVNHPSNNQGQVFWAQRRQYSYLVLPVPFLLGWLFGSMSCRFLYTHPTTTDPKKGKSMYFLQAIKQINPMQVLEAKPEKLVNCPLWEITSTLFNCNLVSMPVTIFPRRCNLCPTEKLYIIKVDKASNLNKTAELISKCCHENKYSLVNIDIRLQQTY